MNYHERYKLRFRNNQSISHVRKDSTINLINNLFYNSTNYTRVLVNDKEKDCLLVQGKVSTEKQLQFLPDENIAIGSYAYIDDETWLLIEFDKDVNNLFPIAKIEKCNTTLKWIDDRGEIKEYPCVFYFNTRSNFGISVDKLMSLPDGRRQVVVQANEDTLAIKHNIRFIFNQRAWKIIDYDFVDYQGLVTISLEEDTTNKFLDNIEERLANYDRLAKYSIEIQNKTLILRQGDIVQLNVVVKRNDIPLPYSPEDLLFESSDESIATVDENGIVTAIVDGKCNIVVKVKGKEDLSDVATVEVGEILEDKSITIIGEDEIPYYNEETYIAKVYEGTNEIVEDVTWSIIEGSQYVNILSQNGNSIILEAKSSSGNVKLVAILVSDNSVIAEKQIRVKSLW